MMEFFGTNAVLAQNQFVFKNFATFKLVCFRVVFMEKRIPNSVIIHISQDNLIV